ncbi:TrbG/VirB9 family P-type conjugative transfer protein [Variovorax sp. dw_954]|uniref:TrbG/VirB9 family P-type conjugative transfer protein n=1 Tax=Variovorax sp. dw_954 TaxID=2720078 RepID=UPI001BD383CE|nr:TrbG/VirB9 family P-type conjugative transfer protein [Variovorax sp. dw_954]
MTPRARLICVAWFACAGTITRAEVGTVPSAADARIQTVRFTGDNVIRIAAAEGVVTTIELSRKEEIKDFAMGDRDAWHAAINGNLFVIKPKDVKADTNLTLFTNRRSYLFQLKTTSRTARNVAYWVRLQYPDGDVTTPEALALAKEQADRKQMKADLKASAIEGNLNFDYWIVGPKELQPLAMHDNGRQTFMLFSAANPMPAAFIVEPDGTESLVDYHVEDDTMVLHRVVVRVLLRRGSLVAGITNRSPALPSQSAPTGTASGKVQRGIREQGGY